MADPHERLQERAKSLWHCSNDVWYTLLETDSHFSLLTELKKISKNSLKIAGKDNVYRCYYQNKDQFGQGPIRRHRLM